MLPGRLFEFNDAERIAEAAKLSDAQQQELQAAYKAMARAAEEMDGSPGIISMSMSEVYKLFDSFVRNLSPDQKDAILRSLVGDRP